MIDEARLAERSSALLRRWLAETHTPVDSGPLRLRTGPLRLRTEVRYRSPTGAHDFGPIIAVDAGGRPVARAEPGLLAAGCSAAARSRAVADAPINTCAGTLVDWVLGSLDTGGVDPADPPADLAVLAESLIDASEARRWLDFHVRNELVPAVRALDPARTPVEDATATLLTRRALGVVGTLGRRGVADETDLLGALRHRLTAIADEPDVAWLAQHWLTSSTLTDYACVNGSGLRYGAGGALEAPPVRYEIPNPLFTEVDQVPGVPVPVLDGGWSLRPVELGDGSDVSLVHGWMHAEHVAIHWGQAWSWRRWRDELAAQLDGDHSLPCIVSRDGRDIAYVELYRVRRDLLAGCYPSDAHDLGVHIAIGEPDAIGRGLGSSLLRAVAEGLLAADPRCRRVVAEPNVHNAASIAAFGKAGYVPEQEVGLPAKNSALVIFPRP